MADLGPTPHTAWQTTAGEINLMRTARESKPVRVEARGSNITFDLTTTALIVIDMQRYFCEPEDRPGRALIEPLTALMPALRAAGTEVIWVNWGNRPDEANLPPNVRLPFNRNRLDAPQPFLTKGTDPADIIAELAVAPDDLHVDKYRLSGFWDTPLDTILRTRRITTLLFAGVNLDQCVYHTLADASFLGYDCILLQDCSATGSPEFCFDATIYNVDHSLGFVTDSHLLLSALDPAS